MITLTQPGLSNIMGYDSKNVICENCGLIIVKGRYRGGAKPHYLSKSCRRFKEMMMLEAAHNGNPRPFTEKPFTGEIPYATFENLFEFFNFMIEFFTQFAGNNTLYSQWKHLWWPFAFSGKRYKAFVRMVEAFKDGYMLCRGDTTADRMIFDFYTSHNRKGYGLFGVDCANECDIFVCGDHVAQVFFDKKLQEKIDTLYQKIQKIEPKALKDFSETLFFEKTNVILTLNRNANLAEKIKRDTLGYFDKEKGKSVTNFAETP